MRRLISVITIAAIILLGCTISVTQFSHVALAADKSGVGDGKCLNADPSKCSKPDPSPSAAAPVGDNTPADSAACDGLSQLGGTTCGKPGNPQNGESAIGRLGKRIVTMVSYIAGIAAIIMIIVAAIRYTTSGGDATRVSAAKSALIYALIGIAVAGLAQILVHFVLSSAAGVNL